MWYPSLDNLKIQGWLIEPPGFDPSKKYPLMLSIHGGPHAMYGVGFNFAWQEHAANGYLVLYTNPRGSTGYGSEFGNAIEYAYPSKDFDDLMKGVDAVIAKGYVDDRTLRLRLFGRRRADRVDGRPHEPVRGSRVAVPGHQLAVVRRQRRRQPAAVGTRTSRSFRWRTRPSTCAGHR